MLSDWTGKGAADAESWSAPSGNLRSRRKKPTAGLRARGWRAAEEEARTPRSGDGKAGGGCFCAQLSWGLLLSLSEETKSGPASRGPDRPGNESGVPAEAGLLGGQGRPVPADVARWPEAG